MIEVRKNLFWGWLMPALLALSLFFSFTAHLRVYTGGVIGPGEVMMGLVGVIGLVFCRSRRLLRNPFILFWALLAFTMFVGSQIATLSGQWQARNGQAYFFTGLVAIGMFALLQNLSNQALRRTLLFLCVFAAVGIWTGFVVYLTGDQELIRAVRLDDQGDARYTAWTSNATQLALFFLPLPVWLAAFWRDVTSPRWWQVLGFGALLFALMLMGLLVRSDALFVVWVCEFLVLLVLRLRWDLEVSRRSLVGYAIAMVLCVALVKIFAHGQVRHSFHCAMQTLVQEGIDVWKEKCYDGAFDDFEAFRIGYSDPIQKAKIRAELRNNGLQAWRESPWFGHGPGAYSWYSDPEYQKAIESVGQLREESHNITIDLLTQGGVFLGLAWVLLLLYLLRGAWLIRDSYTFSVVLMMGVFTSFAYYVRQPFLWFTLIMSYEVIRRRLFVGSR